MCSPAAIQISICVTLNARLAIVDLNFKFPFEVDYVANSRFR